MAERLIIGAMSGTSADGVDVALCRIARDNERYSCNYIGHIESPFSENVRQRILSVRQAGHVSLENLSRLSQDISIAYSDAIRHLLNKLNISAKDISAIAAHGQTMFHTPPLTMQIFDPALVAHQTDIDVISDFRRADCAAGGQGAPLVPFADYHLFRSENISRVILNIGGISNITVLKQNCTIDDVIGFDTGPGNCISDWLMHDAGGVDIDGQLAMQGKTKPDIVETILQTEYFQRPHPKSTDGPAMIRLFADAIERRTMLLPDHLATAAELVAQSIDLGIKAAVPSEPVELIVAGGGTKNRAIMSHLKNLGYTIRTSDELSIPTQAREAIAFAILGSATLDRVPANLPRVTGAKQKVMLGSITLAK